MYLFDAGGRHLRTVDSDTLVTSWTFAYDADGGLVGLTDSRGQTTTIERVGGAPVAVEGPFGHRTTMSVGATGMISAVAGPGAWSRTFTYGSGDLLVRHTDAAANAADYTYGDDGRLEQSVAADGTEFALEHTELTNGREVLLRVGGQVYRTITTTVSDAQELRIELDRPSGVTREFNRSITGDVAVVAEDGSSSQFFVSADPRFGGSVLYPSASIQFRGDFSSSGLEIVASADAVAEPLTTTSITRTTTASDGSESVVVIDTVARTITTTDRAGLTDVATYDARGLLTSVDFGDATADMSIAYDANGQMISSTNGGLTASYTYGSDGPMDSMSITGGDSWTYTHDARGRLTSSTDGSGATTTFVSDALDQLVGWTSPGGVAHEIDRTAYGQVTGYSGQGNPIAEVLYNTARQRSSTVHGDGTESTYALTDFFTTAVDGPERDIVDIDHRELTTLNPRPMAQQARWTTSGRSVLHSTDARSGLPLTVQVTLNDGSTSQRIIEWSWSDLLLTSREIDGDAPTMIAFGYDEERRVVSAGPWSVERNGPRGAPSGFTNGAVSIDVAVDSRGRITGRDIMVGGSPVASIDLARSVDGSVTDQTIVVDATTVLDAEYSRNDRGFVTEVTEPGGAVIESATYDIDGNRLSTTRDGQTVESTFVNGVIATHGTSDLVPGEPAPVVVDANGMVTGRGDLLLDHAVSGELLSADADGVVVVYSYDHFGRRVARNEGGERTWYVYADPARPGLVTETVAADGTITQYLYDDADLMYAIRRDGDWYAVLTDAAGSPAVVVDMAGTVVEQRTWSLSGVPVSDSNPGFDLGLGYAGGIEDVDTGLVRFGARDYDPVLGQWLSPDPISLAGGSANLYRYAEADPISNRDLGGLQTSSASAYVGVGAGLEYHLSPEGIAYCLEAGIGMGGGLGYAPFGELPKSGDSLVSEIGVGPLTYEQTATWDENGRPCVESGWGLPSLDPGDFDLGFFQGVGEFVGELMKTELDLGLGGRSAMKRCWSLAF
jgi:RHS repeat-associated protein